MDVEKILSEMRLERDQLEEAIASLERLEGASPGKRRGRPPAWLAQIRKQRETDGAPDTKKPKNPKKNPDNRSKTKSGP